MLDAAGLGAVLRAAETTLDRMETLPAYAVPSDGGDFQRYLDGAPAPDPDRKAAWHDRLAAERDRGLYRRRVYVAREPLSDYARFECEWGHAPNVHLEDIRVLAPAQFPAIVPMSDWWLIDGASVLLMRYDQAGAFTGAEPAENAAGYVAAWAMAWARAEPFEAWWAAHPRYHRRPKVA
jgi:hypothetical protein